MPCSAARRSTAAEWAMSVPTYDQFIEPLLRFLASKPDGVQAREAHEAVAFSLKLTAEDKQELLPSGAQPIYKNRAGWAHDRLKRAGLSSSPRRGFWRLSESGRSFLAQHAGPLSSDEVEKLAVGFIDVRLKPSTTSVTSPAPSQQPAAHQVGAVESQDDQGSQARQRLLRRGYRLMGRSSEAPTACHQTHAMPGVMMCSAGLACCERRPVDSAFAIAPAASGPGWGRSGAARKARCRSPAPCGPGRR